jgi:hypothetical protein
MFIEITLAVALGIVTAVIILRYWRYVLMVVVNLAVGLAIIAVLIGLGLGAFFALSEAVPTMPTSLVAAFVSAGCISLIIIGAATNN